MYICSPRDVTYVDEKKIYFDEFTVSLNEPVPLVAGDFLIQFSPYGKLGNKRANYQIINIVAPVTLRVPVGVYYYVAHSGSTSPKGVTFNQEGAVDYRDAITEVVDYPDSSNNPNSLYLALLPPEFMKPVEDEYQDLLE